MQYKIMSSQRTINDTTFSLIKGNSKYNQFIAGNNQFDQRATKTFRRQKIVFDDLGGKKRKLLNRNNSENTPYYS